MTRGRRLSGGAGVGVDVSVGVGVDGTRPRGRSRAARMNETSERLFLKESTQGSIRVISRRTKLIIVGRPCDRIDSRASAILRRPLNEFSSVPPLVSLASRPYTEKRYFSCRVADYSASRFIRNWPRGPPEIPSRYIFPRNNRRR